VDLGFSPDGGIYMFAQYGVLSESLKPWADLYAVNVQSNSFVSNGTISYVHNRPLSFGTDGSGALYRVIAQGASLASRCGVTFLNPGKPQYLAFEGAPLESGGIDFRDFETGSSYHAALRASYEGTGVQLKSSFSITLEQTAKNGTRRTYTVGSPGLKRPLVRDYRIRRVVTSESGASMVFIIEMTKLNGSGVDIRYMVETLRL
jgi:predicted secreted protein